MASDPQPDDTIPRTFVEGPSDPMRLADQPGTWVEIDIAAPVQEVWSLVTDINLPARFSEEFRGASWLDDGPAPGARFVGRNQHPATGEWEVECFVEACEQPRCFSWANGETTEPGARWRFDLEPADGGTRLRFSMSMGPGPSGISMAIAAMPDKEPRILHRRVSEHHANMLRTVEGIRDLAEGPA
jgi:uncharacterized protein YndB with AHSA1/START domain